jgi:hypothetical protein
MEGRGRYDGNLGIEKKVEDKKREERIKRK